MSKKIHRAYLESLEQLRASSPSAVDIMVVVGGSPADGAPLPACSHVLGMCCDCVRDMPMRGDGPTEWCVSTLTIDGRPVSRDTMVTYLALVHGALGLCQLPDISTTAVALPVLQFADAVGTNIQLMEQWAERVTRVAVDSPACPEPTFLLSEAYVLHCYTGGALSHISFWGKAHPEIFSWKQLSYVAYQGSLEDCTEYQASLASQLEETLFISTQLGLESLRARAWGFFHRNMEAPKCAAAYGNAVATGNPLRKLAESRDIFGAAVTQVLSRRVLSTAVKDIELIEAFVKQSLPDVTSRDDVKAVIARYKEGS